MGKVNVYLGLSDKLMTVYIIHSYKLHALYFISEIGKNESLVFR